MERPIGAPALERATDVWGSPHRSVALPRTVREHGPKRASPHRFPEWHGLTTWSNVETFDRDVRIQFPPLDFRKLRYKIERAATAGVDKLITFEFSHFLSPNADHPAARRLHRRYREWVDR